MPRWSRPVGGLPSGCGRSRAATALVDTSRTVSCTTVRPCWTCRRSCRHRCGGSPRVTAARPIRSTRIRARSPRCTLRTLTESRSTLSSAVLGTLADRRDELGRARTQTINRLHRLLLELFPGGAKKFLSATQARALIATIKPRDLVGKTRRRLVVELISELDGIDKKIKAADKELQ